MSLIKIYYIESMQQANNIIGIQFIYIKILVIHNFCSSLRIRKTLLTRNLRLNVEISMLQHDLILPIAQERVIVVSGGFLYFVRSRAREKL